ncbi:unnamed protein product [Cunninghamella blakesleeana]
MPKQSRYSNSEEDKDYKPTNNIQESGDEEEEVVEEQQPTKKPKQDLEEGERNEQGEEYFVLSSKRRITIRTFQGKKCVDLREFYSDKTGLWKPTSKGLLMPLDQFKRMVELLPQIQAALDRI